MNWLHCSLILVADCWQVGIDYTSWLASGFLATSWEQNRLEKFELLDFTLDWDVY